MSLMLGRRLSTPVKVGHQPSARDNHNSMTLTFMIVTPQTSDSRSCPSSYQGADRQTNFKQQLDSQQFFSRDDTRPAGARRSHTNSLFSFLPPWEFVQLPPFSLTVELHTYPAGMWLYCSWGAVRLVATSTHSWLHHIRVSYLSESEGVCEGFFFFFFFFSFHLTC